MSADPTEVVDALAKQAADQGHFIEEVTRTVVRQAAALERFLAECEVQQHSAMQDKAKKLADALQNLSDQVSDLYIRAYEE